MNEQLKEGKHLLLTPGIYHLEEPIRVTNTNTIVLGIGLATLVPDAEGVKIHNTCAIMITGNPGISHVINDQEEACKVAGDRKIIVEYQGGIQK